MNELRLALAVLFFLMSIYCIYDLCVNGFDLVVLVACVIGFIAAHYMWPKRSDNENGFYDWLEIFIDFPFRIITGLLRLIGRSVGRLFRSADIDLDL
jgi:hypothetical protein